MAAGELAHAAPPMASAAMSARLLPRRTRLPRPAARVPRVRFDLRGDDRLDAPTNVEVTRHLHPSRFARRGKIIEDAVHGAFVKNSIVSEAPQIELEALELQAEPIRDVVDENRSEIRCPSLELTQLARVALDASYRT